MTTKEYSSSTPNLVDFQTDCTKILEKIGKISASNVRIKISLQAFKKQTIAEIEKSFDQWVEQLEIKIKENSRTWSSNHSPFNNLDKLLKDYDFQFNQCIYNELNKWVTSDLEPAIKLYLKYIHDQIQGEFNAIDSFGLYFSEKRIIIDCHCRDKSKYNYQSYSLTIVPYYRGNTDSFRFLKKDTIKNKITEVGPEKIKLVLHKIKADVINWIENEISSDIIRCANDSFACAISQHEVLLQIP
jgi:hypothetical protein